jgi:hypothetical protein
MVQKVESLDLGTKDSVALKTLTNSTTGTCELESANRFFKGGSSWLALTTFMRQEYRRMLRPPTQTEDDYPTDLTELVRMPSRAMVEPLQNRDDPMLRSL